ncbi:4,5:9,10-diseco-3-hydroxy-5,9,17-trioxoandrosta-1(10),2-diene-4-oate hydrolase [Pseudomonas sp. NFPP10]|uniref:alpha/beta fold hydrolase n=1 Tax=Pseudomonas TaxID=286 RepID=UPI00088C9A16|nr:MULTISPECIES: alpha/beta fold hydrolase [unclassified Pseudomonas]URN86616.1 MAG: alpha/beta fold hydrolase [Pseudomonas protegens]WEK24700.1 MAG: alpha/beta fold hydrolase [Pseudomonas protegens]SDA34807.1 4,5:9,10-diseco-3-hydroxy-5,9,17-trioxoandrosta-1(10),2-diene-4-oate hydrolase [Pseudomonas sp. NFPP12]SEM66965.1 4,5:9,10-diseco-3-hydroxy-5,9,17-trioxoandrosta-1(10),2-diene-4-oate hydrolase [Pseudomonas sp. NFPP10]SFK28106.1 4,5:9,10-diseco-3-hydroxy-5,9,17-trioxoandrosta-1(10),2-dien
MKASAQGRTVTLPNGMQLHYQDMGSGDPVVFIHGSGPGASGHSNFKGNYPAFAAAGYRCIVPDLPGYGASDKPLAQYTLDFFVEALSGLLDALDIGRCVLIGNSLGGAIALQLALDQPRRVSRLVLMAPGGLMDKEQYYLRMAGIQQMAAAFAQGELRNAAGMRRLLSLQLFDPSLISDETVAERVAVVQEQPQEVLSTMQVPNLTARLAELSCPILGFWGVNDQFCPASGAQTLMEHCRQIRMLLLSECGHWVMVEYRQLFNRQCLDFLAEPQP